MKKLILLGAVAFSSLAFAQRIQKGGSQVNGGFGLTSGWGLPIYAGYDYGLTNDITIGGQLSYATTSGETSLYKYKETWFGLSGNANYHFNRVLNIPNNFDFYAGLSLAYNNFSVDLDSKSADTYYHKGNSSGLGFAGQVGGRYFFNNKWGVNLEFGGGNIAAGGKVGITYKLN